MKCPICGKAVEFDDPEMPFCSERCRLLDLGNWASEKYVISTPVESISEENGRSGTPIAGDRDTGWPETGRRRAMQEDAGQDDAGQEDEEGGE